MIWKDMTAEVRGDVVVVELASHQDLSSDGLVGFIDNLVDRGFLKFLVSLRNVPYVDSLGLGAVVRSYMTISRKGGVLKLVELSPRVRHLLHVTRLASVLETLDSKDEALLSFGAPTRTDQ